MKIKKTFLLLTFSRLFSNHIWFHQENVTGSNRNSLKDSVGGGNSNRSSLDVSSSSYNTLIIHNQDDSWPPRPTPIRYGFNYTLLGFPKQENLCLPFIFLEIDA